MLRLVLFALLLAILSACGAPPPVRNENEIPGRTAPAAQEAAEKIPERGTLCRICDFDRAGYQGPLSDEEVQGLLLALNDEYIAWATYDRINKDFSDPRPFVNIQQAEARHISRLKELFAEYKLAVPENKWIGNEPAFTSLSEACKAGVDGEIANRDLYTRLLGSTNREDIKVVYKALQSASEDDHLPAFTKCLDTGGRGKR